MRPEYITHSSVCERDLYFLPLDRLSQFPECIDIHSKCFSVFLALDAAGLDCTVISGMARTLLQAGAVYFCCYGPDCERVHDIIDEEEIAQLTPGRENDGSVIMTTWHANESLLDALWFFVSNSFPDDKYFDNCRAGVAISCGNPTWEKQIVEGMKDIVDGRFRY
jgi:hypothetical protein